MRFQGYKNKKLICPVPGIYSENFNDPLSPDEPLIPYLTDENGVVEFNQLRFSVYGNAGVYKMSFICEGVRSETQNITVATSVYKIDLVREPAAFIDGS